jgi:hypothetical protein
MSGNKIFGNGNAVHNNVLGRNTGKLAKYDGGCRSAMQPVY